MAQSGAIQVLPTAPAEYDPIYMNRLIRILEQSLNQIIYPRYIQATTINISQIPTSAAGLATGDIWNDSGTLKIV